MNQVINKSVAGSLRKMSRFVHSDAHCNFNDYFASVLTVGIAETRKYALFSSFPLNV